MTEYLVKRVSGKENFISKLDELPRAYVANYPWGCAFQPETYAQLAWDGENIYLYMKSCESPVREECECDNGDIYMDSCLEFFINPMPDSIPDYFINFEMNPRRYLYLASGDPQNRDLLNTEACNGFGREVLDKGCWQGKGYWDVSAVIPMEFLKKQVPAFEPAPGMRLKGNFFKCGDETPVPHFGCWSNIEPKTEEAFFYRPECFGTLIFE